MGKRAKWDKNVLCEDVRHGPLSGLFPISLPPFFLSVPIHLSLPLTHSSKCCVSPLFSHPAKCLGPPPHFFVSFCVYPVSLELPSNKHSAEIQIVCVWLMRRIHFSCSFLSLSLHRPGPWAMCVSHETVQAEGKLLWLAKLKVVMSQIE